jgi:hypothetical protein
MNVVGGGLACLGCIGVIYGIPLIMAGIALLGAKNLLVAVPEVPPEMQPFLEKLLRGIKLIGISYILMFVTLAIMLVVYVGVIAAVISQSTR